MVGFWQSAAGQNILASFTYIPVDIELTKF